MNPISGGVPPPPPLAAPLYICKSTTRCDNRRAVANLFFNAEFGTKFQREVATPKYSYSLTQHSTHTYVIENRDVPTPKSGSIRSAVSTEIRILTDIHRQTLYRRQLIRLPRAQNAVRHTQHICSAVSGWQVQRHDRPSLSLTLHV